MSETGLRIAEYELYRDSFQGVGGFGVVLKARDRENGRDVALKLYFNPDPAETGPGNVGPTRSRASERGSSAEHEVIGIDIQANDLRNVRGVPKVIRLFRAKSDQVREVLHKLQANLIDKFPRSGEVDVLVMEFVGGPKTLANFAALPNDWPKKADSVAKRLLTIVGKFDAKGVVHSDLRPGNIRVENGIVWILDFGLARRKGSTTRTWPDRRTKHYWAPELMREGATITPAADLYSLGLVLGHLTFGEAWLDVAVEKRGRSIEIDENELARKGFRGEFGQKFGRMLRCLLQVEPDARFAAYNYFDQPASPPPPAPQGWKIAVAALVLFVISLLVVANAIWKGPWNTDAQADQLDTRQSKGVQTIEAKTDESLSSTRPPP